MKKLTMTLATGLFLLAGCADVAGPDVVAVDAEMDACRGKKCAPSPFPRDTMVTGTCVVTGTEVVCSLLDDGMTGTPNVDPTDPCFGIVCLPTPFPRP